MVKGSTKHQGSRGYFWAKSKKGYPGIKKAEEKTENIISKHRECI